MLNVLNLKTLGKLVHPLHRALVSGVQQTIGANGVQLTEDGVNDNGREILHIETRQMCRCEACYGRHSHQKLLMTLGNGVKVTEIMEVSENYISMKWSDGHKGQMPRTMTGAYGPPNTTSVLETYYDVTMRKNSAQVFWTVQGEDNFKAFDYDEVIKSDENTKEFLAHYMKYGIGFLRGIPDEEDIMKFNNIDLKIGNPRVTVFDPVDMVKFKPNADNFAYSSDELPGHTDLPYYNDSSSAQFFICLKNTVEGGESFWIDTFAAMKEVRDERPELFEILAKVPIFFKNDPPGIEINLYSSVPVVELNGNDIRRVRDHIGSSDEYQFMVSTDIETRKLWWDAFTYYKSKVEDDSRKIRHSMRAGDLVMTDNWRVLHGRKSFFVTAPTQERNVATWYIDWNHLQNRMLSVSNGFLDLKS